MNYLFQIHGLAIEVTVDNNMSKETKELIKENMHRCMTAASNAALALENIKLYFTNTLNMKGKDTTIILCGKYNPATHKYDTRAYAMDKSSREISRTVPIKELISLANDNRATLLVGILEHGEYNILTGQEQIQV